MPSLLLVDAVGAIVAEGRPVTARLVAKRAGGDVFRVEEILRALVKQGAAVARGTRCHRKGETPATVYVLVKPPARRRKRAEGDDQPIAPLPGQKSFPIF